jgi:hypothetical protein
MTEHGRAQDRQAGFLAAVRAVFGGLDVVIGILLAGC